MNLIKFVGRITDAFPAFTFQRLDFRDCLETRTMSLVYNMVYYNSQLKCVFQLDENVSRGEDQNSQTPQGNNKLNFRLVRDQVVLLETATNLSVNRRRAGAKQTILRIFSFFELGHERYNKTLHDVTDPA